MPPDRSIFLIGYRGTGKTTIAQELAERFGCAWADSDDIVQTRAGKPVADIFADEGEPFFRDLEQAVVAELAAGPTQVVALGGGAILREASQRAIDGMHVVWLKATPEVIAERLSADAASASLRPSLTGAGLTEEIEQVLTQRTPIYQQCATLEVDTESRGPQAIAAEIHHQLTAN